MKPQTARLIVERMKALGLVTVNPEVFDRSQSKIRKSDIAPKPRGNPKSPRAKRYATREEAALARKIYRREWFRKVRAAAKEMALEC